MILRKEDCLLKKKKIDQNEENKTKKNSKYIKMSGVYWMKRVIQKS